MKKAILVLTFILIFVNASAQKKTVFKSVIADTILKNKISIRPILIDGNTVWYAGDDGLVGSYNLTSTQKLVSKITKNSASPEFRSIAKTTKHIFILSINNPALLYQISKDDFQSKLVYQESNEKVFYDSMQFWNDNEGIAVGDPIDDCFSIIITRDGGNSWLKLPCSALPKIVDGEAAFAASNTNIVIKGDKTWIVSGGKISRVFYSPDKGMSWQVFNTPIIQGLASTGIYSADFYTDKIGFIAGGNYEIPSLNSGNKALTSDGGKNWKLVAENAGFGYASCIQYIPESGGSQLVSVGGTGLQYSSDSGTSWKKLIDCKDLYTIRFINKNTAIAAGKNIMVKLHFK